MSVVVIGDRSVGKSSTVLELANPYNKNCVEIVEPDYETLRENYINPDTNQMVPTRTEEQQPLVLNVQLPGGEKQVNSVWIDTPGEMWDSPQWRQENPAAWQDFKTRLNECVGIILLLPPHRDLVSPNLLNVANDHHTLNRDDLLNFQAWENRLGKWLDFFLQDCSQVEHIAICLHKADLFCNVDKVSREFQYNYAGGTQWWKFNETARKKYFYQVEKNIKNYHQRGGKPIQFFITSIKNRGLLELPWLYLSPYILYQDHNSY
ncbi:MAG: hypothetical protein DSM107014_01960 [Gomphosphaeria aponina SAG 52.96 = DSM 107014]|uniref:Uncharacterized protein n=1 Tax=Gomphosphaeria aponina SAG 52.96 = DSM 107014 TaxID=1521640 RepID=A0A941GTB4_9CHRO|nr:hypothetical protein [Gomphosphaeria aponina SAG 52.96 = DSM 107014]